MKNQHGYSAIEILIALVIVGLIGFAGWYVWQANNSTQSQTKLNGTESQPKCSNTLAQELASKDKLEPLESCTVDTFVTNNNEKVLLVEIKYGEPADCPSGCIYDHKTYVVKETGETLKAFDGFYQTPDLSLGSDNKTCGYKFSGHLGAVLRGDPDHIKRSLTYEDGDYRWRLELKNFSGRLSDDTTRRKCLRTGTITTNLDGEDVKVIGEPKIQLDY